MKNILSFSLIAVLSISAIGQTNIPQLVSFSAVVRDGNNQPLVNTPVSIRLTFREGGQTGPLVYCALHQTTTNQNGFMSLQLNRDVLGTGCNGAPSTAFENIPWDNGDFWMEVEYQTTPSTPFENLGQLELASSFYAFAAGTAESISGMELSGASNGDVLTYNITTGQWEPMPSGVGINENDPIFVASLANSITALDTANWNNHTVDTDTQLDSAGIAALGYVAGPHTIDTDTQLDSTAIANMGFVADTGSADVTITSISANGDTLYLSNGQTFVTGNGNGSGNLVIPTITTNFVTDITSNSASFGGEISNANGNQIIERGFVYSTASNPSFESNKIMVGNGIGTFDTINHFSGEAMSVNLEYLFLNANTTYYIRAYVITENNIWAYGNEESFTTLSVGQLGPSGGLVFFDKGNNTGGWQYLEAAVSDTAQINGIAWGCDGTSIPGTQATVGVGAANTALVVAGCNEASFAAKLCNDLSFGGQNDWFLPSIAELHLMNINLHLNGQGNFNTSVWPLHYWSSTEVDNGGAWNYNFNGTNASNGWGKSSTFRIRAIRAF